MLKRVLFVVIFLFLNFLFFSAETYAAVLSHDPILKPLYLRSINKDSKGQSPVDVFDAKDPLNPFNFDPNFINERTTRLVDVYFPIDTDPKEKDSKYFLCFKLDEQDCVNDIKKSTKPLSGSGALGIDDKGNDKDVYQLLAKAKEEDPSIDPSWVIHARVCGTASSDLKAFDKCNDPLKVWFHGGTSHRVTLFEKLGEDQNQQVNMVGTTYFFVHHFFPVVYISKDNNMSDAQLAAPTKPDEVGFLKLNKYTKNLDNPEREISIQYGKSQAAFFTLRLAGRKPGNDKSNNYKITVDQSRGGYDQSTCGTVLNKTNLDYPANQDLDLANAQNNRNITFSDLKPGRYEIHISEQIHDTGGFSLRNTVSRIFKGGCEGGFEYWVIPFRVIASNNGPKLVIYADGVEQDPNNEDRSPLAEDSPFTQPCAKRDEFGDCIEVKTALGNISPQPQNFIRNFFQLVLALASAGALFMLMLSGYKFLTSQGDKQKLAGARETITSTIIGLLFIIFSFVILEFIGVDILQIPGLGGTRSTPASSSTSTPVNNCGDKNCSSSTRCEVVTDPATYADVYTCVPLFNCGNTINCNSNQICDNITDPATYNTVYFCRDK